MALSNIGQPAGHIEGPAKVTGRAKYSADIVMPGILWGKCLRSPYPHARIVAINADEAKKLPGVHAVLTGADLPDVRIGRFILDCPVLARDIVRFVGEKVVAVAAESPDIAEEALRLIDVEYEEMPAVFDPREAMRENAPRVHDNPAAYGHAPVPPVHGEVQIAPAIPNVESRTVYRFGQVEDGFAKAARIFEHTFVVPPVHQGYIEPHACAAWYEPGGKVNVWLSNKTPFVARSQIAVALEVPEEQVRVNTIAIGGDFGGKGSLMDSVLCCFLAKASQRPVKMVMSYVEELMAGNPRHSAIVTHRTGVTSDGRITARHAKIIFNCGAYGAFIPGHTVHGGMHAAGSYRVPATEIEVLRVYTNTVPRGHMRAPGAPQTIFTVESHIDMIAAEMGIDPLEFRLRNSLSDGDTGPLGEHWQHVRCKDTLEAAARAAGWGAEKRRWVGRGIALYDREPGAYGQSSATVTIDADARVTLLTGAADTGTGSYTVLQQIVAEELQVPLEAVAVAQGDTDTASYETGAGGSRLTHTAGRATMAAAQEVKQALITLAAQRFGCDAAQVEMKGGRFIAASGASIDLGAMLGWARERGAVPLSRTNNYMPKPTHDVTAFTAQIAEVEIDPETGQVTLRRFITAHDVGTIINPLTHQGQIEGGAIQGIGQALTEHLILRDGAVTTLHLGDYKLPTAMDIPELTTVLLETPEGPVPYAGKAIGESSNVSVPAAIANAVFDATGVRFTELPITAEKIYSALKAREDGRQ